MGSKESLFNSGQMIAGRYEVLEGLGCGGMGEVLRVADHALEKEIIALKILYPERARVQVNLARFRREVLLARKLTHRNIVQIFDFGEADKGYYYISMEYFYGSNLTERIQLSAAEQLSFSETLHILYQLCSALHYAHGQGVIHRDLKPDNILIDSQNFLKLTDFGVARLINDENGLTGAGQMVGTTYYMAPEQFTGQKSDQRVDIYALGILAYEIVTGRRPFVHENAAGLAHMHLTRALPELSDARFELPPWFPDFVRHCVEKSPNNRFQTMAEAADVLAAQGRRCGFTPQGSAPGSALQIDPAKKINLKTLWRAIFA